MNFDQIQKKWQQQNTGQLVNVNTDILLKEVRRNKQYFDAMIFWRDVREAGLSFVLLTIFIAESIKDKDTILLYPALSCLFVGTFMVIDRIKLKKKCPYSRLSTWNQSCKCCNGWLQDSRSPIQQ